jgi:hypothetical protein
MPAINTIHRSVIGVVLATALACTSLDAPDENAASVGGLTDSPTASSVAAATQGLVAAMRIDASTVVTRFGIFGREGYNLDPGNPELVSNYFQVLGDLAIWSNEYTTIKLADMVMDATAKVPQFTAEQQEGILGFAQTVKAIELLNVIRTVGASGAALDAPSTATSPLPAILDQAQLYAGIQALLDSAQTHLQAAGTSFPFALGPGFAGFDTPPTFILLNRAIRARADIDIEDYPDALTDLSASFLSTTQPMSVGVYFTYSTVSGDLVNPLYEAEPRNFYTHPSIVNAAQLKADNTPDARVTADVREVTPVTRYSLSTQWAFKLYSNPAAPIPLIRNEELILLRAEANLGLSHTSLAIQDINVVRTTSGGLQPISDPYAPAAGQPATLLNELLYEKRYSMMWQMGSSSWIDARHYGRLAALPHDLPGYVAFPYTRLPDAECNARDPKPAGCTSPAGF